MKKSDLVKIIKSSLREMKLNENIVMPDSNGLCECGGHTWSNCVGGDGACSKGCCEYEGSPEQWAAENGFDRMDRDTRGATGQVVTNCTKKCCNDSCTDWCIGTTDCECCKYMVDVVDGGSREIARGVYNGRRIKGNKGTDFRGNSDIGNAELTRGRTMMRENKETLARFKKLAGLIKEEEEKEEGTSYEELKTMMLNEKGEVINEQLFTALGGLAAVLGAAGVTSAIEMALEDPAIAEKYPKLAKVFEFLGKIGGALGKGIK